MDNFNLRTFLIENKLTSNSRINEAKFPTLQDTEDGKVIDEAKISVAKTTVEKKTAIKEPTSKKKVVKK